MTATARDEMKAPQRMLSMPMPRPSAAGAAQLDLRPRARRRRRHHDVSRLAHHRRRDSGRFGGERMAVGRRARSHHPGHPRAGRDIDATVDKAASVARNFPGIARGAPLHQGAIERAARAVARQRAHARRIAGAAADRGADRGRCCTRHSATSTHHIRTGAGRRARRSSRLDRTHARHGGNARWPPALSS